MITRHYPGGIEQMRAELDRLRSERDEALAALKRLVMETCKHPAAHEHANAAGVGTIWRCPDCGQDVPPPKFTGSLITHVNDRIAIGCISPEARDLLDRITEAYAEHSEGVKNVNPKYRPPSPDDVYGAFYWLVRWSGLIQPAEDCPIDGLRKEAKR